MNMDPEEGTCAIDRDSRDSVRGEPLKVHANAHNGMQESGSYTLKGSRACDTHIPPVRVISPLQWYQELRKHLQQLKYFTVIIILLHTVALV